MTIRIVVVDDQQLVRTGFAAILSTEEDLEVVGQAANGAEALDICTQAKPDVVLMDIRMPVLDGVEATRKLTAHQNGPKVLILTTFDLDELVHGALAAGASGFMLKDAPPEDLIRAVRIVASGDSLLAPSVTRRLIAAFASTQPVSALNESARTAVDRLTDRELEVLKLVSKGLSNTEIAEAMFVAETTVKTHVSRILSKLDARDRVQAVVVAFHAGVATPGSA
jgi:DNA-binding NarL/FixJ family response regulator